MEQSYQYENEILKQVSASTPSASITQLARFEALMHHQFLKSRLAGLKNIEDSLKSQFENIDLQQSAKEMIKSVQNSSSKLQEIKRTALFQKEKLVEFALGSITKCFGEAFHIFENRKHPRIPNGDLMLMDRVIHIDGTVGDFKNPAEIITEYDVPENVWYIRDNAYAYVPMAVIMEIALQPCGFLSAYLGTSLIKPELDFLFRNLDGSGIWLATPDLIGKTIINRSRLIKTIAAGGTIIQKFEFELSVDNTIFYRGESSFGYFAPETMQNQTGLDRQSPWQKASIKDFPFFDCFTISQNKKKGLTLSDGHMDFLDKIWVNQNSGKFKKGYIYAEKEINNQDWFFKYHFFQDPVMPGSLGVEAILQAMQTFAIAQQLDQHFTRPEFTSISDHELKWRYRGQITPKHNTMALEIHIKEIKYENKKIQVVGEAHLWIDGLRIYEIENASIAIFERN
jgi:3-hydroxymyristoyl/3-hydroxydecanoyl-(acyl carrier protein) dehydratase